MAATVLNIKQWGNDLGVRLPAAIAREAHLRADQRVRISVEAGQVVITPLTDLPLTLEQRLALFDPVRHGGEAMATGAAPGLSDVWQEEHSTRPSTSRSPGETLVLCEVACSLCSLWSRSAARR